MSRWLTVLVFLAFISFMAIVVVLSNQGREVWLFQLFEGLPHYDKIGHFILMGLASFFAVVAIAPQLNTSRPKAAGRVMAIVLLVVTVEEFSQISFSTRTFSLLDLLCSAAGVLICGGVATWCLSATSKRAA